MKKILTLTTLIALSSLFPSVAQAAPIGLSEALSSAFKNGKDLTDARSSFYTAQADLTAKKADPTTLVVTLEQSQNSFDLAQLKVGYTRLQVLQNLLNNYAALLEGQNALDLGEAQLALDKRNLDVAQAKLAAKNATELDVSNAQNTYTSSQQNLTNSKAQIPVLSAKLEQSMGINASGDLTLADYPKMPDLSLSLNDLENDLTLRVPSVLQASQSLEIAALNVKLSDNDWTPKRTLEDAKTNLETAKRALESSQKDALTGLRDAYRNAQDAFKRLQIAQKSLETAKQSYSADQTRFKSGVISKVQLQQSEVSLQNSQNSLDKTRGTYLKSLSSLSVAAGRDVTGWAKE